MAKRVNIRTINGKKHNALLPPKYQRIQNRAAAVLDAWEEHGSGLPLDVVANLHRISLEQIHNDTYGDPLHIDKRFGVEDSTELERALRTCLKEIRKGINPALVAVSNHVPFCLISKTEDVQDIKRVANEFLRDMSDKLIEIRKEQRHKHFALIDRMVTTTTSISSISPLQSIENHPSTHQRITCEQFENTTNIHHKDNAPSNEPLVSPTETLKTSRKRSNGNTIISNSPPILASTDPVKSQNNALVQSENVSECAQSHHNDIQASTSLLNNKSLVEKHSIRAYHRASFSSLSNLMEWNVLTQHGLGLHNHGHAKHQQNKCYLNAIIQCLANTAPFAQWLLCEAEDNQCQLKSDHQFCSVCELRSIFNAIHTYANRNTQGVFSTLSQATADPIARRISEISSALIIGRQEDPSELFVFLLNHLSKCLSPIDSIATVIQDIFGMQLRSVVECSNCRSQTEAEEWSPTLAISIDSQNDLIKCIAEFCEGYLLKGDNAYQCGTCAEKVIARKSYDITQAFPIITIHMNRYVYDQQRMRITKVKKFINFPELLDLTPYFNRDIQESISIDKENNAPIYELYAVIVHLGENANEGHIYAYIRSPDGFWYKADDKFVTRVDINRVLTNENSYMLFYSKATRERSISNRTTLEASTIPSSVSSSTSACLSTLKIHENNETIDHQNSTICSGKEISCINNSEIQILTTENISLNEQSTMSCTEIPPKHYSTPQLQSQISIQSSNEKFRLRATCALDSRIEYQSYVNANERVYDKQSSDDDHVHIDNINDNNSTNNIPISSSISYGQASPILVTINDSPDNRSTTSQYNTSTSLQSNVSSANSISNGDFVAELPTLCEFTLEAVDRTKLQEIRAVKIKKRRARLLKQMGIAIEEEIRPKKIFLSKNEQMKKITDKVHNDTVQSKNNKPQQSSKVDVEYFYVLYPYIKRINPYCGLCIRNCTFGVQMNEQQQLLRCDLRCAGRPICPFRCSIVVRNNGEAYVTVHNNHVRHKQNSKICRPIRHPERSSIKQQFAVGASLYRMYQSRLQKRTTEERKGKNYDVVGKSRGVLQKIKSEGVLESLLSPDADQGLLKLNEQYRKEINRGGKVEGAIQLISAYPCRTIVYTESSIRLYDSLLKHHNIVVSWDATGGIIKQSDSLRLLYYEFSITLPGVVTQDSIIPITFMISDSHSFVDVSHWMQMFRRSYHQVFPGQDFPRPRIVLSDRAQVFLMTAVQIWNDETMSQFLNRAYRIVTRKATEADYKLTNIHACLSHVALTTRKMINKLLDEKIRSLAMWSIALLINTSSWDEMIHNWKLICHVFLQLHIGNDDVNNEHHDALLNKIIKIKSNPNIHTIIQSTEPKISESKTNTNTFDYYDSDEDTEHNEPVSASLSQNTSTKKKNERVVIDEEEEMNSTNSPFKVVLNEIFENCLKDVGISVDEAEKPARHGILRWFKYLTTSFLPTIPVWSNLLLGDLHRYQRRLVASFESLIHQPPEQRTTATSERRMGILKRAQLGNTVHIRLDVLLSILIPDMLTMIEEFSTALLSYTASTTEETNTNNDFTVSREIRMKPVQENWNKPNNKRNSGRYTKAPDESTFTELMSVLIAPTNIINDDLKIPTVTPSWINTALGLLLSTQTYGTYFNRPPMLPSDIPVAVDMIRNFLEEWSTSAVQNIRSSTVNFNVPTCEEYKELDQQSRYILEQILTPLLDCKIIGYKVYVCKSCNSEVTIRTTFTCIPVVVSKTGLHIERDLLAFFGTVTSDLLCSTCGKPTLRHIKVIRWPQVIMINVVDSRTGLHSRKPPPVISLAQFSDWLAIGTPSSTLYDLITFNSILHVGDKDNMVRITKSKTNWITSVNKKRIGNGEQLRRLYGNSRILIFERIFHQTKYDMVRAIARCAFDSTSYHLPDIPISITLQEACSTMETNSDLNELKNILIAEICTCFYCYMCHKTSDALVSSNNQIFMFKPTDKNEMIAHPIVYRDSEDCANNQTFCTYCEYSIKDVKLPVYKQIFYKCPIVLMKFVDHDMSPNSIFDSQMKLTDSTGEQFNYVPVAVLIMSQYSNTIHVIKRKEDHYVKYTDHLYTDAVDILESDLMDLFDTSMSIIAFYRRNRVAIPQSSMQIVSRDMVNGTHRLTVRSGEQLFLVTCGESNTNERH